MPEKKKTRNISEEERQRRSEVAIKLHQETVIDPETGLERPKFGGIQPGGVSDPAARTRRAGLDIAERMADPDVKDDIWDGLTAGLGPRNSPTIRGQTAKRLLDIEEGQRKALAEERREIERGEERDLLGELLELVRPHVSGRAGDVVDGELVEVDFEPAGEIGPGDEGSPGTGWAAD